MRKLLVYIVLLMHVNTYMFFPMIDEKDVYEKTGKQKDDINSLAEYIYQVLLGHRDSTPEDEDDDQAHFYHIKSGISYIALYNAYPPAPVKYAFTATTVTEYGIPATPRPLEASYDINGPPPEA